MIILPRNINNVTVKKQGTVLPFLPIKRGGGSRTVPLLSVEKITHDL